MEMEQSNEHIPNTETKKSAIGKGPKTAALRSAMAAQGGDEVEKRLVGDVVKGTLEEPLRKPSKTEVKVECTISDIFWFDR
jgi:hypothetical protein